MTKDEIKKAERTCVYTGFKHAAKADKHGDLSIVVINHAGCVVGEFNELKAFSKAMVRRRCATRRRERKEKRIIRQL